ncbi:MAG: hypothetical protein JO222_11910 [Frankiales bacterium]|nr:hypothetical protein [Frankiales bacterium]
MNRRTAAAVVLCVLPLPTAAVLAALVERGSATSPSTAGALVAAQRAAREVLSYDYRTMNADLARAEGQMTPSFRRAFASTAASLAAEARQVKAIVQATPAGPPGIVSAVTDRVVVLLFVDQAAVKQTPGTTTPTTRIDQERVQLTMTRSGGRWLVAGIAAL